MLDKPVSLRNEAIHAWHLAIDGSAGHSSYTVALAGRRVYWNEPLPITYAHAQILSSADDEGDGDPFAELEEDDDELNENETVLEDC